MHGQYGYTSPALTAVRCLSDARWTRSMLELVGLSRALPTKRSAWSLLAEGAVRNRVPTRMTYLKSYVPTLISVAPAPYGANARFAGLLGQDLRQWQVAAPKLASAIGVPNVVVTEPVPGVFELQLRIVDPLSSPLEWSSVPAAHSWSLSLGIDEMGVYQSLPLANVSGVVVGGVPGSGKTAWLTSALGSFGASAAVQFAVIDGKGGQDLECLRARSCRFMNDDLELPEIAAILNDATGLVRDRIRQGNNIFGSSNFWDRGPTPQVPLVFVVIDECQAFLDPRQLVTKERKAIGAEIHASVNYLVRKGRSAGVVSILSTQKPTADSLPTDIRDNASLRVCFGVQSTYAATAVLEDGWRSDTDVSPLGMSSGVGVSFIGGHFRRFRAPFVRERVIATHSWRWSSLNRDPWELLRPELADGHVRDS
ncbi:cell division protein FtsK [Mycobacterium avium subsp. paratuberculosis]|nr:cell division protein FtsK [Mycobacterium avium subsp. paratuberculosis]